MKILYLHQYFSTPDSSGGTRSYEMARRLVLKGHQVDLITSSASLPKEWSIPSGWSCRDVEGVKLHIFNLPYSNKIPFAQRILIFLKFMFAATLKARKIPCDMVLASSTPLTIGVPGVLAARKQKVPFIFEVRDLWPDVPIALGVLKTGLSKWLARKLEAWTYANANHVIALSPGIAAGVFRCGFSEKKLTIIPNAADVDFFTVSGHSGERFRQKFSWLGERPLVVYTGTFGLVNNLTYLVDVAAEMLAIQPDVRFAVVGDGLEKEKITNHAKQKGVLNKNFYILPPVPKTDVPQILSAADFAVSTVLPKKELWDNSANKFFDALAASRPIAINYGGWQADIIEENDVGVVMDENDPALGAKELYARLCDRVWIQQSRKNARTLAVEVFCREIHFAALEKVLQVSTSDDTKPQGVGL